MDSLHTSPENGDQTSDKNVENEISIERIEAMVTAEQVLSDTVARKRRTFTRKRGNNNKIREQTPLRDIEGKSTTDEEINERPKTPERKRKRIFRKKPNERLYKSETEVTDSEYNLKMNNSLPKQKLGEKRESFANLAQAEVLSFLNKTKKTLKAAANKGKERFKKIDRESFRRSRSVPYAFTEEEIAKRFQNSYLLRPSETPRRKYSDCSLASSNSENPFLSKPFRPEVQEFVRQRKKLRQSSPKIIEVLEPKTLNVIATKTVLQTDFKLLELISVLRTFSLSEIIKSYKAFKSNMTDECTRIKHLRNRCFTELFILIIFCGLGALVFRFVEGAFENFYKCGVKRVKRDFIDNLWIKSHNLKEEDWKSLARNKLRNFEEELHTAHEAGMKTYSGQRSWSFLNAIVYCFTIITTIGYGHIYPETRTGKALTIVYAIIGIPLFLLALTDFGKLFTRCIKFLWSFVRRLYYTGSCRSVRKTAHVQEIFKGAQMMYEIATFRRPSTYVDPETLHQVPEGGQIGEETPVTPAISNFEIDDEFNLPISVAIFILVLYIFLGALIYWIWEGWDFFDSFYFVFISMSTVGFGDMVPDDVLCMIVSIVYLVFGLALMSMCINVVQVKLSDTFRQASTKIGATIGISVAEEDGSITIIPPDPIEMPKVHETTSPENESPKKV